MSEYGAQVRNNIKAMTEIKLKFWGCQKRVPVFHVSWCTAAWFSPVIKKYDYKINIPTKITVKRKYLYRILIYNSLVKNGITTKWCIAITI